MGLNIEFNVFTLNVFSFTIILFLFSFLGILSVWSNILQEEGIFYKQIFIWIYNIHIEQRNCPSFCWYSPSLKITKFIPPVVSPPVSEQKSLTMEGLLNIVQEMNKNKKENVEEPGTSLETCFTFRGLCFLRYPRWNDPEDPNIML